MADDDVVFLRRGLQKPLPEDLDYTKVRGITRTQQGTFKAYSMIQGFSIDTWAMPGLHAAWANRTAMQHIKLRVSAWLTEDRPVDEPITDGEFAAFFQGILQEVRATTPDIVAWQYHTEIKLSHKPADLHRVKTVHNLPDALRSWRQLRQNLDLGGKFSVCECVESLRDEAEEFARRTLSGLGPDGIPNDSDALSVLRLWAFKRNTARLNVIPDGKTWVASDTLGLVIPQDGSHVPVLSKATQGHESVFTLLRRWAIGRLPEKIRGEDMPCTSMSMNKGYAAKLHRDGRNEGPSVGASVGDFKGGRLMYWPSDDGRMDFEVLRSQPHVTFDTKAASVLFNGNLGHAVEDFSGERYSVILFTIPRREKASSATRLQLEKLGIGIPTDEALLRMRTHLPGVNSSTVAVKSKASQKKLGCKRSNKLELRRRLRTKTRMTIAKTKPRMLIAKVKTRMAIAKPADAKKFSRTTNATLVDLLKRGTIAGGVGVLQVMWNGSYLLPKADLDDEVNIRLAGEHVPSLSALLRVVVKEKNGFAFEKGNGWVATHYCGRSLDKIRGE